MWWLFFTNLFSTNSPIIDPFPSRDRFPKLSSIDKSALERAMTNIEIHNDLFGMASLKVSRVGGYHAKFYQLH